MELSFEAMYWFVWGVVTGAGTVGYFSGAAIRKLKSEDRASIRKALEEE